MRVHSPQGLGIPRPQSKDVALHDIDYLLLSPNLLCLRAYGARLGGHDVARVVDDGRLAVDMSSQGSEFVADVVCGRDQPVCLFEEAVMILEDFAVEIQETLFKALEVAVADCRDVGGNVFGGHDVHVV